MLTPRDASPGAEAASPRTPSSQISPNAKAAAAQAELERRKDDEHEKIVRLFAEGKGGAEVLPAEGLRNLVGQLGIVLQGRQLAAAQRELGLNSGPMITLSAFCKWWASRGLGVGAEREQATATLWRAFCAVDEDGSGSIDAAELASVSKKMGIPLEGDKITEAMLQIDKDGSGEVEFEEFADWLMPILFNEGGGTELGANLGLNLELLGGTGELFNEIDSESSEEEEDKIGAAEEMFNDLLAQSFGGSKEMFGLSLGMFPPDHRVRVAISKVVFHPVSELFILGCIFINLVALLFQHPGDEQVLIVSLINTVCGVIFTIEMCCRIVVHGFWGSEGAYLRNGWNVSSQNSLWSLASRHLTFCGGVFARTQAFDFIIVLSFWSIYIAARVTTIDTSLSATATLLRSFRMLRFFQGISEVLSALGQGRPMILTVSTVLMFLFIAFSTSCKQLYGGALIYKCGAMDPAVLSATCSECIAEVSLDVCPTVLECQSRGMSCYDINSLAPKSYTNQSYYATERRMAHIDKFGFNGVFESLLTVYTISTLDEWGALCNPYRASTASTAMFAWPVFAGLVILLALFATNLFVASVTIAYMSVRTSIRDDDTLENLRDMVMENLKKQEGIEDDEEEELSDEEDGIPDENLTTEEMSTDHCCGRCSPSLTLRAQAIITTKWFDNFIMATVLLNIVVMASEHHNQAESFTMILLAVEYIFTVIYTFEVTAKLQGLGAKRYFKVPMNRLDFTIVFVAILGYVLELAGSKMNGSSAQSLRIVRVLARLARLMRVARVGKLLARVQSIRTVLKVAFGSWQAISSLSALFVFVVFVSAMIASFIFWPCHDTSVPAPGNGVSRTELNGFNLGSVGQGSMAIFQLATGDDWSGLMFEYMECYGFSAAGFFVIVVFVTRYLLLNLYISVFLENFQLNDEQKRLKQIEKFAKAEMAKTDGSSEGAAMAAIEIANSISRKGPLGRLNLDIVVQGVAQGVMQATEEPVGPASETQSSEDSPDIESSQAQGDGKASHSNPLVRMDTEDAVDMIVDDATSLFAANDFDVKHKSLGLFSEAHVLRATCIKIVENNIFDSIIVVLIICSGLHLALEGPSTFENHRDNYDQSVIDAAAAMDTFLFVAFWVECILKVIAYGFVNGPTTYLKRASANVLDFTVVTATSVDVVLSLIGASSWASIFRLLRVFRLARLLLIIDGMSVILQTLVKALPSVAAILGLQFTCFIVFGILGINLFSGKYYRCVEDITLDRVACEGNGLTWERYTFNFDNIGESCCTLFICITIEGWVKLTRIGMDTTKVDYAPYPNDTGGYAFSFFAAFMILNAFMLDKLFVGVLVDFFQQESGSALMTAEQKNWRFMEVMSLYIVGEDYRPPTGNRVREECYKLAQSKTFQRVINMFIILDVTAVVVGEERIAWESFASLLHTVDELTLAVYSYESTVKILAYGWGVYISDNRMSFAIVVIMWVMMIHYNLKQIDGFDPSGDFDWIQGLSFVQVLRMARLMQASVSVRKLLQLITISLPGVLNLVAVMVLQFFIFGILGMKLYGDVPLDRSTVINEFDNFGSVVSSMMMLFNVATGTPIGPIVEELLANGASGSFMFFLWFYIFANIILLNLFTALLLDNLDLMGASDFAITDADILWFHRQWNNYGYYAMDTMHLSKVRHFVQGIGGSFATITAADPHWYKRLLLDLEVPPDEDVDTSRLEFTFHRILMAVCHMRFNSTCLPYELEVAARAKTEAVRKEQSARVIISYYRAWRTAKAPPASHQTEALKRTWAAGVYAARLWCVDSMARVYKLSELGQVEKATKNLQQAMEIMQGWSGPSNQDGDEDEVVQMTELDDDVMEKLAVGDAEAHEMLLARMEELHLERVKVKGGIGTWCVGGRFVGRPFRAAQTVVLTFVIPAVMLALFHVLVQVLESPHVSVLSPAFVVLVVLPALSLAGCCYIICNFFLNPSAFSARRQMLMFSSWAGIANYGAILFGLTDAAQPYCRVLAIVNQSAYFTQMAWQVMATYTAFRFIRVGQLRLKGAARIGSDILCWLGPLALTMTLYFIRPDSFHEDLSEVKYLGWCGVRADGFGSYYKWFFVFAPQLVAVTMYAYCFAYITEVVDPPQTTTMRRSADESRVTTSHHEDLLLASSGKQVLAMKYASDRIKLYMSGFMLSYLTNSLITIVLERKKQDSEWTTFDYLICAVVVTPQQFMYARVYNVGGTDGMMTGLANFHQATIKSTGGIVQSRVNSATAAFKWQNIEAANRLGQTATVRLKSTAQSATSAFEKTMKDSKRGMQDKAAAAQATTSSILPTAQARQLDQLRQYILQRAFQVWQFLLLIPVALWVWTPLEFIKDNYTKKLLPVFLCLLGYSLFLLFPVFYFKVNPAEWSDVNGTEILYWTGDGYSSDYGKIWETSRYDIALTVFLIVVAFICIAGAFVNRYNHDLLVIDTPSDSLRKTKKNMLGCYTLFVEWFQIAFLAFTAGALLGRYRIACGEPGGEECVPEDQLTDTQKLKKLVIGFLLDNIFYIQYYMSIFGVVVWGACYALPAVVEKIYSRASSLKIYEHLGFIFLILAGPGFLMILKSLMKPMFCIEDPTYFPYPVVLADKSVQCWSETHLKLVWPGLVGLCIFFPSSTLTTAIKYSPQEDVRFLFLYTRFEFIVKGLMLFFSLRLTNQPSVAMAMLMLGSSTIVFILHFMKPCCLYWANRWKHFTHVCNIWTCLTCQWAIAVDNTDWKSHLALAAAGWITLFIGHAIYEYRKAQNDCFNIAIDDPSLQERCSAEILQLRREIAYAKKWKVWGVHASILRLLRYAKHEDLTVRRNAFETLAALSYWDHVTNKAFFVEITANTAVQIVFDAISLETDEALRIFAVRFLGALVRRQVYIVELTACLEDSEVDLYQELSKLARFAVRPASKIDCMQTLQALAYIDSNALDAVARGCIPILCDWLSSGSVIEQHLASEMLMLISSRTDLTSQLIQNGALPRLVGLFIAVDDIEYQPETLEQNVSDGFRAGKLQPLRCFSFAHHLPGSVRDDFSRLYKKVADIDEDLATGQREERIAAQAVDREAFRAWVNSGTDLGTQIKQLLIDNKIEGVKKVKATGVKREHLDELFALIIAAADATNQESQAVDIPVDFGAMGDVMGFSKQTKDATSTGPQIAAYLAHLNLGLGSYEEVLVSLFETGLFQHGIGQVAESDLEDISKDVFTRWLVQAHKAREPPLAVRILESCLAAYDASSSASAIQNEVEAMFEEIGSHDNDVDGFHVLHKHDIADYLIANGVQTSAAELEDQITHQLLLGETDIDAHVQLSAKQLQILKDEIVSWAVATLTEIAIAQSARGRKAMVDGGVLVITKRCFSLLKPSSVHVLSLSMLHALMAGSFTEEDIYHDGDLTGFYYEIKEFKSRLERDPEATHPMLAFGSLTAKQRRQAHMMAVYCGMYHRSTGSPINREVLISDQPLTKKVLQKYRSETQVKTMEELDASGSRSMRKSTKGPVSPSVEFSNPLDDAGEEDSIEAQQEQEQVQEPRPSQDGEADQDGEVVTDVMGADVRDDANTALNANVDEDDEAIYDANRTSIMETGVILGLLKLAQQPFPVSFNAIDTLLQFAQYNKVPEENKAIVREQLCAALFDDDLGIASLGAWGLHYMGLEYWEQTRAKDRIARWRPRLAGIKKFRQVVRVVLAMRLWLRAGTEAGQGLDTNTMEIRAAIG